MNESEKTKIEFNKTHRYKSNQDQLDDIPWVLEQSSGTKASDLWVEARALGQDSARDQAREWKT